jgi:hypothetical protein
MPHNTHAQVEQEIAATLARLTPEQKQEALKKLMQMIIDHEVNSQSSRPLPIS